MARPSKPKAEQVARLSVSVAPETARYLRRLADEIAVVSHRPPSISSAVDAAVTAHRESRQVLEEHHRWTWLIVGRDFAGRLKVEWTDAETGQTITKTLDAPPRGAPLSLDYIVPPQLLDAVTGTPAPDAGEPRPSQKRPAKKA